MTTRPPHDAAEAGQRLGGEEPGGHDPREGDRPGPARPAPQQPRTTRRGQDSDRHHWPRDQQRHAGVAREVLVRGPQVAHGGGEAHHREDEDDEAVTASTAAAALSYPSPRSPHVACPGRGGAVDRDRVPAATRRVQLGRRGRQPGIWARASWTRSHAASRASVTGPAAPPGSARAGMARSPRIAGVPRQDVRQHHRRRVGAVCLAPCLAGPARNASRRGGEREPVGRIGGHAGHSSAPAARGMADRDALTMRRERRRASRPAGALTRTRARRP